MKGVWTRADLCRHYDEILEAGLSPEQLAYFRRHGRFGYEIITQVSSGSSGHPPLLIPRGREDILDIMARITHSHHEPWSGPPERLALLGGISHVEGALKLRVEGTVARAFELAEAAELIAFEPDYITCYPSIARVLVARHADAFPQLKTIKLGGERVLQADIDKIHAAFPTALIVEQLGSTELPAVAVGTSRRGEPRSLELQTDRFSFLLEDTPDWQPLVARDNLPGRLFPLEAFYDAGDEVRIEGGRIVEVRRRDDPANAFAVDVEALLADGCVNVQLEIAARIVYFDGAARPDTVVLNGDEYRMVAGPLRRLKDSNKLPLLIG